MLLCSFPSCKNPSRFKFPSKTDEVRKKWLQFIGNPIFTPKGRKGLCEFHFADDQFIKEGIQSGLSLQRRRLKKDAVPTITNPEAIESVITHSESLDDGMIDSRNDNGVISNSIHSTSSSSTSSTADSSSNFCVSGFWNNGIIQMNKRRKIEAHHNGTVIKSSNFNIPCTLERDSSPSSIDRTEKPLNEEFVINDLQAEIEIHTTENEVRADQEESVTPKQIRDACTQTPWSSGYSIHNFKEKDKTILYFTGLKNYRKFRFVLESLGPGIYSLQYKYHRVLNVSIEDQLFMTLWKLRRNTPDDELAEHFQVSHTTVENIFHTWINFMDYQWKKINVWPERELVDFYMPETFKKNFPATRVIIDGTELAIQKPINPLFQQITFSSYKHKNTLKVLVGCTPSGLISYQSPAYGGSASDRQLVERSDLTEMCQAGDSIMADRGFNVQDIFAPHGVKVDIPTFLKGKNRLPGMVLLKDRKLARHRVHIERIIALLKTYLILAGTLQHAYVPIASQILNVCVMLCNFRECIMK